MCVWSFISVGLADLLKPSSRLSLLGWKKLKVFFFQRFRLESCPLFLRGYYSMESNFRSSTSAESETVTAVAVLILSVCTSSSSPSGSSGFGRTLLLLGEILKSSQVSSWKTCSRHNTLLKTVITYLNRLCNWARHSLPSSALRPVPCKQPSPPTIQMTLL